MLQLLLIVVGTVAVLILGAPLVRRLVGALEAREARRAETDATRTDHDPPRPDDDFDSSLDAPPREPPDRWSDAQPEAGGSFFEIITAEGTTRIDLGDFDACHHLLAAQVVPAMNALPYGADGHRWAIADGLALVLVYDFGTHEHAVPAEAIARWAKDDPTLRRLALARGAMTASALPLVRNEATTSDGVVQFVLTSTPTNFVGAWWLQHLIETPQPCLFGLPDWCNVIHRAVDDTLTVPMIVALIQLVWGRHEESTRPAVPWLYWHADGAFARVDVQMDADGRPHMVAPPALVAHFDQQDR